MKIVGVFLNPEIRTGGHKRYLELIQSLSNKGHEVYLILNSRLEYEFRGINFIKIDYDYKKKIIPYSLMNYFVLWREKSVVYNTLKHCDYIIIFGETHLKVGLFLKRLFSSKLLFSFRSNGVVEAQVKRNEPEVNIVERLNLIISELKYRYYENRIGRNCDILVFQSNYDRESFLSRNRKYKDKAFIIHGNIGGNRFDPNYRDRNQSSGLYNILFVGALSVRKGIRYLVQAVVALIDKGFDIRLTIAGKGSLRESLENRISSAGYQDHFVFLGKINNVLDIIANSDLVVVPSIFDSYPNVVIESLHTGTPVVGARAGGIPEMLSDECLFEPGDTQSLYLSLYKLLQNPSDYRKLKENVLNNRQKFHFDWGQMFIDLMERDAKNNIKEAGV